MIDFLLWILVLGAGATVFMDVWSLVQKHILHWPVLDYALVGRWAARIAVGRGAAQPVVKSPPVRHERALGWGIHYFTGLFFAGVFLAIAGPEWRNAPEIRPALLFGAATVLAPFLILQPALGAGIAASRTPRPNLARTKSLVTHLVFGLGLYICGIALSAAIR